MSHFVAFSGQFFCVFTLQISHIITFTKIKVLIIKMFSFFSSYLTILITNYKALLWSGLLSGFVSSMVCLCFLDVFLQVMDAKALFLRLEERGLLDNQTFLSQLLHTIGRIDLLSLLETDGMQPVETDANPMLSEYR